MVFCDLVSAFFCFWTCTVLVHIFMANVSTGDVASCKCVAFPIHCGVLCFYGSCRFAMFRIESLQPYVSRCPDMSYIESFHTPCTKAKKNPLSRPDLPCEALQGNMSRLVDGGGAEAGGRCACQGAPTDEHMGRASNHLI